jgi:multidrug resistance efflux pump
MSIIRFFLRLIVTIVMVAIAAVLVTALWRAYMLAPWTRDGRVEAQVVDVAPEVSGTVTEVPVHDNQFVHKGDVLFALDKARFQLAIAQAQAQVDTDRQQQQLRTSDVKRRAGLTGIVSAEEQERVANTAAVAASALSGAEAALDLAKLNLQRSVLYAPANGYVTHLRLRVGDYATAGQPKIAIVDSDSFWVSGFFEETKLAGLHVGDQARMKLMGYDAPMLGHVESIGRGITDPNDGVSSRGLPTVNPIFTWVRLAQRIPVRIAIDHVPDGIPLVSGLTASVSVGPDATPATTPRGKLLSWLEDNL